MSDSGRVLRNARREVGFVLLLWLVVIAWTIGVSYWLGYERPPSETRVLLGMPAWVVFGVILPWIFSTKATIVFCLRIMKDDDLGREQEAGDV